MEFTELIVHTFQVNGSMLVISPAATDDDGSCIYEGSYYDRIGNCLLDVDGDLCDEFEVVGCQDLLALNYNPEATDQVLNI